MKLSKRARGRIAGVLSGGVAVGLAVVAGAGSAEAATRPAGHERGARGAVFVQTDGLAGNEVVVYDRAGDGTLTAAGRYRTGGLGGALAGSVVDHLASQGALVRDPRHGLLFAVNAGSDSLSVFGTEDGRLQLRQVVGTRGSFPVSVSVHGELVYVLNALGGGSIQGFRIRSGRLEPIAGSWRALKLDPAATPQFTHTPGQVSFTPDGSRLLVTTKANGSAIDVFAVDGSGRPSAQPVVNAEPGAVPFAMVFDRQGRLVVANAGTNSVTSYTLRQDGTLAPIVTTATGQKATCWIASAGGHLYASNAASATLTGLRAGAAGELTVLGQTGTDPGTVDAAATPEGRFLYVQTGATGTVDEFRVGRDGSLTPIGSVLVPGAVGGEGIAAS